MKKLIPVILCGGAGARLWPLSRQQHPKPFIRLQDDQSLLQKAFLRGIANPDVAEIIIVTNREFYFITEDDIKEVNSQNIPITYILEPVGRNTAPAITSANIYVQKKYGDEAILLILAADHIITDLKKFRVAINDAINLAQQNNLVTFGITPTLPETGYGYIEAKNDGSNLVKRFIEKPNQEKAARYVAQGNFYWNSGMFCFNCGTFSTQMNIYAPDIFTQVYQSLENSKIINHTNSTSQKIELSPDDFAKVEDLSIDYALMEKANNVAVVAGEFGWSDVGSWSALGDLISADANGNRILGNAEINQSTNCAIFGGQRTIGVVGVENLVVVDTPDALLITHKEKSQDVKEIYNQLKSKGNEVYRSHKTVSRPWGTYTVIDEGEGFKLKKIMVKPQASLSLQMHHHRSEHWVVVRGVAIVTNGEEVITINVGESTYIPLGNKHRLENRGDTPLIIVEVQIGSYLGEDDIVRFDDVYGRN